MLFFFDIIFLMGVFYMFIDTHCHIYKEYYEDIESLMRLIKEKNIKLVINNGCNFDTCEEVIKLSKEYESMYFTLGLHPSENLNEIDKVIDLIKENVNNNKFVGIGEIGLDYYWNNDNKEKQIQVFDKQLSLAEELNLPVIIHSRESTKDMLDILKKYKLKGIIHCFNGSVETAREYIKMGFKLGINGVVTFKNCKLIEVIREVGVDNIVFETDSPYLTPNPDRGKQNNPSYVNIIAKYISENLNISIIDLENITNKNVSNIFDITI